MMYPKGFIRPIDESGCIYLPLELREFYGIKEGSNIAILPHMNGIRIIKLSCETCPEEKNLSFVNGRLLCAACAKEAAPPPRPQRKEIRDKLRELRCAKGYTQQYVAKYLGITRWAYSHYESGQTEPSLPIIRDLAELYEIPILDIFWVNEEPPKYLTLDKIKFGENSNKK